MILTHPPQTKNTEQQSSAMESQKVNPLGTIPILWSWPVQIQEEKFLPNEWQKRVIRRCDESLVSPTINQQPLERWDDGELQLGLGFLQKRGLSNHEMNTITNSLLFLNDPNEMLNTFQFSKKEKKSPVKTYFTNPLANTLTSLVARHMG